MKCQNLLGQVNKVFAYHFCVKDNEFCVKDNEVVK